MAIQGVQIIYRLRQTVRLFIDYRENVDSFNLYYCNTVGGVYALIGAVDNVASTSPASRGKVVYEFSTESLTNWVDTTSNYIKLAPVVGVVEGAQEGPLKIPSRTETIAPKEFSVMFGFNKDTQKFVPVAVDGDGNIITV